MSALKVPALETLILEEAEVRNLSGVGTIATFRLPALRSLTIKGGRHDFSALKAPALETLDLEKAELRDLIGVGTITTLRLVECRLDSLDGLEEAKISKLDLTPRWGSNEIGKIGALARVRSLRYLKLAPSLLQKEADALRGCSQIETFCCPGYEGSLSFLTQWVSLKQLDLHGAGVLNDVDTLVRLPALEKVFLRGAKTRREDFPPEFHSVLDFTQNYP